MRTGLLSPASIITSIVFGIGIIVLMTEADPFYSALFFVPFCLSPLIVSLLLAATSSRPACQRLLCAGSILYGCWFGFVYVQAFILHPDPQSAIALLFVGIYSLPVMLPIWIITLVLQHGHRFWGRISG